MGFNLTFKNYHKFIKSFQTKEPKEMKKKLENKIQSLLH